MESGPSTRAMPPAEDGNDRDQHTTAVVNEVEGAPASGAAQRGGSVGPHKARPRPRQPSGVNVPGGKAIHGMLHAAGEATQAAAEKLQALFRS